MQNKSFNVGGSDKAIVFQAGRACPVLEEVDYCDWEYRITTDRILHPDSLSLVRLVIVNANHLRGSGAWDYLILFTCNERKLHRILESEYLYGAKLQFKGETQFAITLGQWQRSDASCCPSHEKEELFLWNSRDQRYIVINSKLRKLN